MGMARIVLEEARLVMLRELAAQPGYSLNEALLQATLETFGIARSREWVREEMRRLAADLGAVTIREAGTVIIATLTAKGREHVEGVRIIEGVKRPGPRE